MNAKTIVNSFGFHVEEEPVSIYPFSPVYQLERPEGEFIVKKTQTPIAKANRLMNYTKFLKTNGVDVVTPAEEPTENPMVVGDATYVVYPFIKGETYSGQDREIIEAGRLLGRIHGLSPVDNEFELDSYDVYDFNEREVNESFQNIVKNAAPFGMEIYPELEAQLIGAVHRQEKLKQSGLPNVATPHDFKANNLIYVPEPHLIDPDNACWIPRIFDLALVLLLFHNELASAPDRPFTQNQWKLFLEGYGEFVTLTELEKTWWPNALEHVFLDEVMWLMAEVEEDWKNPAQRELFGGLMDLLLEVGATKTLYSRSIK
ncbi:MAG TPA: phosphotransferase [Planococcus sp. (in: firmicutes)]|nr:phosphotransferase [Planococcus sp. (in: firmicutes)]